MTCLQRTFDAKNMPALVQKIVRVRRILQQFHSLSVAAIFFNLLKSMMIWWYDMIIWYMIKYFPIGSNSTDSRELFHWIEETYQRPVSTSTWFETNCFWTGDHRTRVDTESGKRWRIGNLYFNKFNWPATEWNNFAYFSSQTWWIKYSIGTVGC